MPLELNIANTNILNAEQVPLNSEHDCVIGRSDKYFSSIEISDTLYTLYFLILRQVCFLTFFDLRTPSFANLPIYIY